MKEQYPHLSSLVCYAKLIRTGEYSKAEIEKNFKLVDKADYTGSSRTEILKWLKYGLTTMVQSGVFPLEGSINKNKRVYA